MLHTTKPDGFVSPIERDLKRTVVRENAAPAFGLLGSGSRQDFRVSQPVAGLAGVHRCGSQR